MKASDWRIPAGHTLAVQIGTIESGAQSDWIDTPTYQTIAVSGARLTLELADPTDDVTIPGERALFLDAYLGYSAAEIPVGPPSFTVPDVRG